MNKLIQTIILIILKYHGPFQKTFVIHQSYTITQTKINKLKGIITKTIK